ncbi:MAG TPA: hypothetical protein VN026_18965 [Bacteroidia bacterium]|jgi:hypothetical protein|nr:hypothetical protein [Bacteroidia bacterium]
MRNNINFVTLWFSAAMVILVIAGAIAFTFTDFMADRVYGIKRLVLTLVFLAYAVYRSIRIYQVIKSKNNDK